MVIRYKVVYKNDRSSCSASILYRLYYPKDTIVTAIKKTLGIFCFENYIRAQEFIQSNDFDDFDDFMILRVKPIGRKINTNITKIPSTYDIFSFYETIEESRGKYLEQKGYIGVPLGTVLYKQVYVLD